MLVFMEGGKPKNPEKNPRSKDENQQQTQPTYNTDTGNRTRATLVEGECSHHCAIPAPRRESGSRQHDVRSSMKKYPCTGPALNPKKPYAVHSSAIDHGAEETLSHWGEKLLSVCETTCLGTGAEGRKQVTVFEGDLFITLAIYAYIYYLLALFSERKREKREN